MNGIYIKELYPDKAQYKPKETVRIIAELAKEAGEGQIILRLSRLGKILHTQACEQKGAERIVVFEWLPGNEGCGYGADAEFIRDGKAVDARSTAFDIAAEGNRAARYGFLSDFDTKDRESGADVDFLRKMHINLAQFYDWSYRHDHLVSDEPVYADMMGRRVDLATVKSKVNRCREYGIRSIGYGAVYAASKEFYEAHRDWGLYTPSGAPYVFIDTFYIMNIARDCPWHGHIIAQYGEAMKKVGFDGIHMDTYGFPKAAVSHMGGENRLIRLNEHYPALIDDARESLSASGGEVTLIFNNVGNWPVKGTAQAAVDYVYIEVWPPFERYHHIKQIILDAAREAGGKPVILAAYMEPFRNDTQERAFCALLIMTAVTAANGATHLCLGGEGAALTQGYYCDHVHLKERFIPRLRSYYDFTVRYMDLLFDTSLEDVSMTHIGWDNMEYRCGAGWSAYGEPGKIWLTLRENERYKTISLINLCGAGEDYWNAGKDEPVVQDNVGFRVLAEREVKAVYYASPDIGAGKPKRLPHTAAETERGTAVSFSVPKLVLWGLVWMEMS